MTATNSIRSIALSALILSQTGPQVERRKHFTKVEIAELAESLKTHGILQPIVARPHGQVVNGPVKEFEIVAGERRYLAAKAAAFTELLVNVRELNDEQCLEVQLIENLQRKDLHPLQEAEGYEQLMKLHGHHVDELGDKVGKSKAYVYARIKLLALCKEARQAFYDDKLNASTALLLARIPLERLQTEALKEITDEMYDGPMSYRDAAVHIQCKYMLRLDQAPFPTADETLCRGAVACGRCPKNTSQQPGLFGDVKGGRAGVCTDPTCFKAKREAWAHRQAEEARASGQKVIEGAAAKKVAPYGTSSLREGYISLDDRCYDDPKNRTYRQLLGKSFKPILLKVPNGEADGEPFIEIADRKDIAPLLKAQGVKASRATPSNPEQSAREKKAKAERALRAELFGHIRQKLPGQAGADVLQLIAHGYVREMQNESVKQICRIYEIDWTDYESEKALHKFISSMGPGSTSELVRFLQVCYYAHDLQVSTWKSDGNADRLLAAAKFLKIDVEKIRRELAAAEKTKAPKKKARK